jgi:hypothetical protein
MKISTSKATFEVELNNSETAKAVLEALPIKSKVNKWGDEIYGYVKEDKLLMLLRKELSATGLMVQLSAYSMVLLL